MTILSAIEYVATGPVGRYHEITKPEAGALSAVIHRAAAVALLAQAEPGSSLAGALAELRGALDSVGCLTADYYQCEFCGAHTAASLRTCCSTGFYDDSRGRPRSPMPGNRARVENSRPDPLTHPNS